MSLETFNSMEIDAIGEIMNISLGASATAISTMLGKRVDITTPTVKVVSFDEFEFSNIEPAVGVEITYISGLEGNNILLLKRKDVKVIVEILMGMEIPDEEFELNEMNMSAICEVMNQMMGSSSTALSEFLGEVVNISTPVSFEVDTETEFKDKYFVDNDTMVVISFILKIDDIVSSEFLSVMSPHLAKRIISGFGISSEENADSSTENFTVENNIGSSIGINDVDSQAEEIVSKQFINTENVSSNKQEEVPVSPSFNQQQNEPQQQYIQPQQQDIPQQQYIQPQQPPQQPQYIQPQQPVQQQYIQPQQVPQQQYIQPQQPMMQQQYTPQQQYSSPAPEPKVINVQPVKHQSFDFEEKALGEEQSRNLALILSVPLEVSVEIGRTKKVVKEILEYSQGSLIVLDKLAGEQVDIFVNGQCIAKGDVVVVDDCFGVKITEVLKPEEIKEKLGR